MMPPAASGFLSREAPPCSTLRLAPMHGGVARAVKIGAVREPGEPAGGSLSGPPMLDMHATASHARELRSSMPSVHARSSRTMLRPRRRPPHFHLSPCGASSRHSAASTVPLATLRRRPFGGHAAADAGLPLALVTDRSLGESFIIAAPGCDDLKPPVIGAIAAIALLKDADALHESAQQKML